MRGEAWLAELPDRRTRANVEAAVLRGEHGSASASVETATVAALALLPPKNVGI